MSALLMQKSNLAHLSTAILASATIIGIFAAIGGITLARNGRKKINENGEGHYLKAHLTLLQIGQILAWVGLGLAILWRIGKRFL